MSVERRELIWISWALAALCVVLLLVVVFVANSVPLGPRRAEGRPSGRPSSGPSSTPRPSDSPSPSSTPSPNQGSGSGSGTGGATGHGIGGGSGTISQPSPSYSIGGVLAQQLRPGNAYPLDLTLTNLSSVAMSALDLQVSISHVTAPNATVSLPCTVSDFEVTQVANRFSVALSGNESTSLSARGIPSSQWPQISMLNTAANQDGCKGASLALAFTGSSTVAP